MLTEDGLDQALKFCNIPVARKALLPVKSYEIQKIAKKITESRRPANYNPIDAEREVRKVTRATVQRMRGFRQAVVEAYSCRCAVCGLKLNSPDALSWEVEAAHIVPHHSMGRDDIWNGLALCHLHHWAFDVGWFTLRDDYVIEVSTQADYLPPDCGRLGDYEFVRALSHRTGRILLPEKNEIHPHQNALRWHRNNVFHCNKDFGV
jgi:predicted restriction endonuclease